VPGSTNAGPISKGLRFAMPAYPIMLLSGAA